MHDVLSEATPCVPAGCPSPAEIAAACAVIRKGWSAAEHYRRAGKRIPGYLNRPDADPWTAPVMAIGDDVGEPRE